MNLIRSIDQDHPNWYKWQYSKERIQWVPVQKIVGSAGPRQSNYYEDWTPTPEGRDDRFQRIWDAMVIYRRMVDAPDLQPFSPVQLVKIGDDYYVVEDGNRRVSVAHMLHFKRIKARVTEMYPNTLSDLYSNQKWMRVN